MSRLFSFGFGGEDDIERDIDQEESSTEPFNAVGAETPGPEPQPHYLKDLVCTSAPLSYAQMFFS